MLSTSERVRFGAVTKDRSQPLGTDNAVSIGPTNHAAFGATCFGTMPTGRPCLDGERGCSLTGDGTLPGSNTLSILR